MRTLTAIALAIFYLMLVNGLGINEPSEERPENTDELPQNTDELSQNTLELPQNTDERPQNTDERPQNTDERPQNTVERQMWTVIDESMHEISKYFDYNTLLTRGIRCKKLVFDGITSIIERADNEAAQCSSAQDPNECLDDVTVRIGLRYRSGRVPIRKCINRAGMTITDKGINNVLESFINNTISVVIGEVKKDDETPAATKKEEITDEVTDNSETEETDQRNSMNNMDSTSDVQQDDKNSTEAEEVPLDNAQSRSIKPTSHEPRSVEASSPVTLAVKDTKTGEASPAIIEEAKSAEVAANPDAIQIPALLAINAKPNDPNSNIAMEFKRTVIESVRVYITPVERKPLDVVKPDHLSNENTKAEPVPANEPKPAVAEPAPLAIRDAMPAGARP